MKRLLRWLLRGRHPLVRQYDTIDCGPAALLSLLRYWGGDATLVEVRERAGTDALGTTLHGLAEAARAFGFDARGARGTYDELLREDLPCLAHVIVDGRLSHFLVVFEADEAGVLVGDPGRGRVRMTREEFETIWRSRSVLLAKPAGPLPKRETRHWTRWIASYLELEETWVAQALFIGLVYTGLGLLTAVFVQSLVDRFIPAGDLRMILLFGGLLLGVQVLRSVAGYLRKRFLVELSRRIGVRMGEDFLTHLFRLPRRFFDTRRTGDITARLNDALRIQSVVLTVTGSMVIDVLVVLGSLAVLWIIAPPLGWIGVAAVPAYGLALWFAGRGLRARQHRLMADYAELEATYFDSLSGIDEILGYSASDAFAGGAVARFDRMQTSQSDLGRLEAKIDFSSDAAGGLLVVLALTVGGWLVVEGSLQLGQVMGGYSLLASMVPALGRLFMASVALQGAAVAAHRLTDLFFARPETREGEPMHGPIRRLELRDARFSWPREGDLLDGVDLTLEAGRFHGLWGPNGSGKSTLAALLLRKYPLSGGSLLADGRPVETLALKDYRARVAVLSESVKIFSGTVAENILLGRAVEDEGALMERLERFGVLDLLRSFEHGLMTRIGEEGRHLSAGERQTVGLARALAGGPSILVVDEGLSHLDVASRRRLEDALRAYARDHAVLLISHDPALMARTEHVYVLDEGRIVEQGDLLRLLDGGDEGVFARAWSQHLSDIPQPARAVP